MPVQLPVIHPTALKRARQGARFLDQAEPGWEGRINPQGLDMADGNVCIVGQVFGSFMQGSRDLYSRDTGQANAEAWSTSVCAWSQRHGFYINDDVDYGYHDLQQAWELLLIERGIKAREEDLATSGD